MPVRVHPLAQIGPGDDEADSPVLDRFSGLQSRPLQGWQSSIAKGGLFPWHDESLRELFEQVSEAGVDRVQELFEERQAP